MLFALAGLPAWAGETARHPAENAVDYEARYVREPEDDPIQPTGHAVFHHAGLLRTQRQQADGMRSDFSRLGTTAFITLITGADGTPRSPYFRGAFDEMRPRKEWFDLAFWGLVN